MVFCAPAPQEEAPTPYEFTINEQNANHTLTRQESGDAQGTVTGSYSYTDKDGLSRTVNYIADNDGFRAQIQSNEPGLVSGETGAATYSIQ